MNRKNIIIVCITSALVYALPVCSYADPGFYIANDSLFEASFKSGDNCSTYKLGMAGYVKPQGLSGVNTDDLATLCGNAQTNCIIDVYMTKNCSGPSIVTVTLDQSKGIVSMDIKQGTFFNVRKQSERTVHVSGGPVPGLSPAPAAVPATAPAAVPAAAPAAVPATAPAAVPATAPATPAAAPK